MPCLYRVHNPRSLVPDTMFTETDQRAMLASLPTAVTAVIDWRELTVDFRLSARDVTTFGETVESDGPYLRVTAGQVAEHSITRKTLITINDVIWSVTRLSPEQSGFTRCDLTRSIA